MTKDIGDLESSAPGSAARQCGGKPPLALIPLKVIADVEDEKAWGRTACEINPTKALRLLGNFQMRLPSGFGDNTALMHSAVYLGSPWADCARVFDYGRHKYAEWNWLKGMPWSEVINSCARHLLAMMRGQANDPESGLPHVGHAMCNLVMLMQYTKTYLEGDDRPKPLNAPGPSQVDVDNFINAFKESKESQHD